MNTKKNISFLDRFESEIDPKEARKIEKRMKLAARIQDAMKDLGWKHQDLLDAMGKKNLSEVSKWISGIHNFTSDTLFDLEEALGIQLIGGVTVKEKIKIQYKTVIVTAQPSRANLNYTMLGQALKSRKIQAGHYDFSFSGTYTRELPKA